MSHPTYSRPVRARSGRHPVSAGHLVMGVVFLAVAAIWVLVEAELVQGADVRWLLPVPWVLGGGIGVVALVVAARRRDPEEVGDPDDLSGDSSTCRG